MSWNFDYLIVGTGFAGLVMAERLITQTGAKVLMVEKRSHIGGNANDKYDDAGVLIHQYGPHYFRTNSPKVRAYLSQFTDWHPVDYTIKSFTRERFWNFPINLNTFEQLKGAPATSDEFAAWLEANKVPIENPRNSEDIILSQVGHELYELFFKGYTLKQWKRHPRELDASVCGRIPIRTNRNDRYLKEDFQALPKAGYHKLFERMVSAMGDAVTILLNTDYREVLPHVNFKHMVYTGPIDAYFDFQHGHLPYRSLRFEFETFQGAALAEREHISGKPGFWQPAMQVNYPDASVPWTRIVEIKHATGQQCHPSTIVREFPEDFTQGKEPYYPVPNDDSKAVYLKYKEMADALPNVSFIGRLATYRYYNMDQVVGMALSTFDKLTQ
jgi:UDP-galactopyranose mutase